MGKTLRKLALGLAVLVFGASWAGVAIAYLNDASVTEFTVAVTIAAIATEVLIWALAFIAGWSAFANRRALWRRITGKPQAEGG